MKRSPGDNSENVGINLPDHGNGIAAPLTDRTLVLLDFDGTITTRDTLIELVRFYNGSRKFWLGMLALAPIMVLFRFGLIPNWRAKEFFLAQYFKGEKVDDFDARCKAFSNTILPRLIRPGAQKAIEEFKNDNATIAIVSASAENWVKPWCDANGLICLATRLDVEEGRITGKIKGRNCHGDEKVCRIKEAFDLDSYQKIFAYGDSSGDKEMLAIAHESGYKPWRD